MTRSMHRTRALRSLVAFALAAAIVPAIACATTPATSSLVVTATAYNSLHGQTNGHPNVAAWGDELRPGMKAIAVSKDLQAAGLTRGMKVKIDGLPGEYVVLDRMPSRWEKRIDIYMGEDVGAARQWGKREVRIYWSPLSD
jgi:3D (Asp-Asp-Asp) domain-containing protein